MRTSLILGFALLTTAVLAAVTIANEAAAPPRAAAADFELSSLKGEKVRLSALRGQVVIVSFWATWCAPCLVELPHLEALEQAHGAQGLVVLAVNSDGPETASLVRSTVKRQRWKMRVLLDTSGTAAAALNPRGVNPMTLFIDRQGRIAHVHEGYKAGDEASYAKVVQGLLAEPAP